MQQPVRAFVQVPSTAPPGRLVYPARRVVETVRWSGVDVANITVCYADTGQNCAAGDDSDWSIDGEAPLEQPGVALAARVTKVGHLTVNIAALHEMHELARQFKHNENLVKQFDELAASFLAWRPVRGDGNCYYRAVLFAWLQRAIAHGRVENVRAFMAKLKPHRRSRLLSPSVRICRRLMRAWIATRNRCTSDNEVRSLLTAITDEFNRDCNDYAFILCLRHLVAEYLHVHAQDPIGSSTGTGDVLTYESWARAISGARNISDYCEQHVYVMHKDAADHVQHVCPRVLNTVVRICMVDRDTAQTQLIDYGDVKMPSCQPVRSASQLSTLSSLSGSKPEVYLLFKPGHYDILIPREDRVGKLLDPDAARPNPERGAASPGCIVGGEAAAPEAARLCRQADARWRSLVQLAGEVCERFTAVLQCLDTKLEVELGQKRKRLGSLDESFFEGQLSSLLDPLREAMARLHAIPEDSPFAEDRQQAAVPASGPSVRSLLPALSSFLQDGRPGGPPAPGQHPPMETELESAPRAPRDVRKPVEVPPPPAPPQRVTEATGQHECCICMKRGATAVARCGCGYHNRCLQEYAVLEKRPPADICCHLHDKPLGSSFVSQYVPYFATGSGGAPSGGAAHGSSQGAAQGLAAAPPPDASVFVTALPPATRAPSRALAEAPPIGLSTQLELDILEGKYKPPVVPDVLSAQGGGFSSLPREHSRQPVPLLEAAPPRNLASSAAFAGPPKSQAFLSQPQGMRLPATVGDLGCAFGVPCVICFGEDGVLKTLHCRYKAHKTCLKSFWMDRVTVLGRLTDIRCPAEVAGCEEVLNEGDLRNVVGPDDLVAAERSIRELDKQNQQLINDLKRQSMEYKPMFMCTICLIEHEVEGCCTLPCQHRFCFASLQYHFDLIVRERRLSKLACPAEGCGYNLQNPESIHIFQQCLPEKTYHKLLEFLTRDDPHVYECKRVGCEERLFLDDEDDYADLECPCGHRFCAKCENGPHPGVSCEDWEEKLVREKREEEVQRHDSEAWRSALELGWKPCPRSCAYGGGYKAQEECDHVTCKCGFEFCWDCGVERQITLLHDNRWHKPRCRYYTSPSEVSEPPRHVPSCPECRLMQPGRPCNFPPDDGYPESFIRRRSKRTPRLTS